VVPERDRVGAGGQQPLGKSRRDSGAVGRVLAVDDAEVDLPFLAQGGQPFLDSPASRDAEDIGDEQDVQG
jgi:hypothetical protein